MSNPDRHPAVPPPSEHGAGRTALARKWAYLLSGVVVVPLSQQELDRELREQLDVLCDALHREPFHAEPVERVGERLVALGYVGEAGLRRTMDVLGKGLLALPEFEPSGRYAERIVRGIGALASGFLAANRRVLLEQQETMHLSLLKAVRDAKWNLKESEARFEQVAMSSSSGIMLVDLEGRLVRANAAIGEILGHSSAELTGTNLADLVHPDSADFLANAMRALVEGRKERVRLSQRMVRKDGEVARISLTASLLRNADNEPSHFVAVVEDGTELMLLQNEISRQALHDVLTGLPNRQFFSTQLESALHRADPQHGVTLFHLDLDAFSLVCDSLGRDAGERVLIHVAQRLKSVLAREKAMIARFDGDEFGILVENTATTPDLGTIVAEINNAIAEPCTVDGHGLAVSASIGVVHRPARGTSPAELLRAADLTLRRAKTGRRGQWELFHPDHDAEDRRVKALAVQLPGAWERGEVVVRYRPLVRLGDRSTAGVEASLSWERPGHGPLPPGRCAELAEQTGLILPLGEWLLRLACGQAEWWRQRIGFDLPLFVRLTRHQAADGRLVSRVAKVLDETGLRPVRLQLGVPSHALHAAETANNLAMLADLGVRPVVDDFGLAPAELATLPDLPARSVRLTAELVERQRRTDLTFVRILLELVRQAEATVLVDGIETEEQAAWWLDAGATTATGELFGGGRPPEVVAAHLTN